MSDTVGRFETFDANKRFVVVRDDEGYGIWRLDDLEDGAPIQRFADDDRGYEAAVERWRELTRADRRSSSPWMGRLKVAVIGSAAISVVSQLVYTVMQGTTGFSAFSPADFLHWAALISNAAIQVTIALLAIYIVIWLDARRHPQ